MNGNMEEIMSNKGMGKMVVEKSGKCIFTITIWYQVVFSEGLWSLFPVALY